MNEMLSPGDRVSRCAVDWFTLKSGQSNNQTLPDRHGTVTDCYYSSPWMGVIREDWVLYRVLWDDSGIEERGYMREGLTLLHADTTMLKVEGWIKT